MTRGCLRRQVPKQGERGRESGRNSPEWVQQPQWPREMGSTREIERRNKKKAGIGRIEKREIMQKREERRERICAVRQTQVVVVTRRANSGLDSG